MTPNPLVSELDGDLRVIRKKNAELTYGFLLAHIDVVSGLTFRAGSKYVPKQQRDELRSRRG